jgi:hypothetical protein
MADLDATSSLYLDSNERVSKLEHGARETRLLFIRCGFWIVGTILALVQTWSYRYAITADGVSYLDLSDAVFPGTDWHRIITGVWSPLYPLLLGLARMLRPERYSEVVTGHLLGIAIFLGAFAGFEFLLRSIWPRERSSDYAAERVVLPRWACFAVGYSVFLWAAVGEITLRFPRPDMLMAIFLFVAMGLLARMQREGPTWGKYVALGATLGLGYLSKSPMLPIGLLIIAASIVTTKNWFRALPKGLIAAFLLLATGSAYFLPLTKIRGHLTLGESSSFNYLIHVDQAGPNWYLQSVGRGSGSLQHRPAKIFDEPPVYQFSIGQPVTHPLRYDPSYWTQGATPRFSLRDEFRTVSASLVSFVDPLTSSGGLIAGIVLLCFVSGRRKALAEIAGQWPLWLIGLSGLGMYAIVHVEDRYIGAFFALLWMSLFAGVRVPRNLISQIAPGLALGVAATILIPLIGNTGFHFLQRHGFKDVDAQAARALASLGIRANDRVARISPSATDYAWAHMLGVSLLAEVDIGYADAFWSIGPETQNEVLKAMGATGARMVVAHVPQGLAPPGWQRLGNTPYWIRWLNQS